MLHIDSSPLTEEENKLANDAKQQALSVLRDALKKKDILLVENPEEFGHQQEFRSSKLISTDLVKELISQLKKVTFKRGDKKTSTIAYVYPTTETENVYLCPLFWEQHEFPNADSQPFTLIHEVSHLLGYGHTVQKNTENLKMSPQYKLCPVSVWDIEKAFSQFMNHSETHTNGSYSCCGEKSRETVCEKSAMSYTLRYLQAMRDVSKVILNLSFHSLTEEEYKQANEAKQQTLSVLSDALKKKDILLVEDPEEFGEQKEFRFSALISTDLVKELISQLEKVVFRGDPGKKSKKTAYVCPAMRAIIYLCPPYWKQHKFPDTDSLPFTLIHEVSLLLGYGHSVKRNQENLTMSPQCKLCPVSARDIEKAFSLLMNHSGTHTNGSYSCCGEKSRDTVCEQSAMSYELRYLQAKRDLSKATSNMLIHKEKKIHYRNEKIRLYSIIGTFSAKYTNAVSAMSKI